MTKYTSQLGVALITALMLAACSSKQSANADSTAAKDLQPPLGDTAVANASGGIERPAAPMVSAGRVRGQIPRGATGLLHPESRVCTNTSKVGEHVFAAVVDPVHGSNDVVIPAGARVKMRVTALRRSENVKDPITIGFEIETVAFGDNTYPMRAMITDDQIERIRDEPKSKDVQKVLGGALIGAIAGKLIGKSTKGAVIGGAAGAAAGAGVAVATANYDGCIPAGSAMKVVMMAPLDVK